MESADLWLLNVNIQWSQENFLMSVFVPWYLEKCLAGSLS